MSGKKKQNTIKFTKWCDQRGRTLFEQHPDVECELDSGYRGLHRDHPDQAHVPPRKLKKDAPADHVSAWDTARHDQSSRRICVEHSIADSKNCLI